MKRILLLSMLCSLLQFSANAQCIIPNPSFENWSQQEFPLEFEDGSVITGSALMPDNYMSLYKFAFGLFVLAFGDSTDYANFENNTQDFFGVARSEDASEGNYALKLYGNSSLDFSDIVGQNECEEIPESFSLDVKHVGIGFDTLVVSAMWDQGLNVGSDEENPPNAFAAILEGFSEDGSYQTITIPIEKLNENPSDTFAINFFTTFENYQNSYFLFDNLKFNYSANTQDDFTKNSVQLTPNPARGEFTIKSDIQNGAKVEILDAVGRIIKNIVLDDHIKVDLTGYPTGIYLVKISDHKGKLIAIEKLVLIK